MDFFVLEPLDEIRETDAEKSERETLEKLYAYVIAQSTFTRWIAETNDPELVKFFIECLERNAEVFTECKPRIVEDIIGRKGEFSQITDHCIKLGVLEEISCGNMSEEDS